MNLVPLLANSTARHSKLHSQIARVFIFCMLSFSAVGCWEPLAPLFTAKIIDPKYERRSNYDNVVVFVHGIFGDGESTWTNTETGAYWPRLLLNDKAFADSDIYVFAYSSPFLNQSYTLDELIENMRMVFDRDEVFSRHKRIIFICHSMGGLIVRGFLQRYQVKAVQVPFIYFFSTPTDGSHITEIAKFLSHNPQVKAMLPAKVNEYINFMQKNWRAIQPPIRSYCAYEIEDTYGFKIVDEKSATMLCDGPVDPLPHNHLDVVKPKGTGDLIYSEFVKAFKNVPAYVQFRTQVIEVTEQVTVGCGKIVDKRIRLKPAGVAQSQKIVAVIPALQNGTNLKSEMSETVETATDSALIHVHLAGLDKRGSEGCREDGNATLQVSFVVNDPVSN